MTEERPPASDPGVRFLTAGETALVVEFGVAIDPAIHERVLVLDRALAATTPANSQPFLTV